MKTMLNTIEEALDDLKQGKVIIVVDDEDLENEGDLVVIAEFATPENINFMATYGRGLICTPITETLAEKLDLHGVLPHTHQAKHINTPNMKKTLFFL